MRKFLLKQWPNQFPHVIRCFQIPDGQCAKMESITTSFWWGQKGEERKIYWVRWVDICKSKKDGGMGCRKL